MGFEILFLILLLILKCMKKKGQRMDQQQKPTESLVLKSSSLISYCEVYLVENRFKFVFSAQGLRIAPPEAPVTGYMFGKGLYFADMVSKSANYCCTNRTNNTG